MKKYTLVYLVSMFAVAVTFFLGIFHLYGGMYFIALCFIILWQWEAGKN